MDWKDISINRHAQIVKAYDVEEENRVYALIGACYGMTLEQVLDSDWRKVEEMAKSITFLNKKPKVRMARRHYTINGHRYDVQTNMKEITTAQYIDFQMLAPNCEQNMAQFLSVLLVPEGKKYNQGYDVDLVQKEIGDYFNVEDALALSAFFFKLLQILLRRTTRRFLREKKKAEKEGLMTKEQREAMDKLETTLRNLQSSSMRFML